MDHHLCAIHGLWIILIVYHSPVQMKSVGEVMAIGRTWQESLQKALRGMESGLDGWSLPKGYKRLPRDQMLYKLRVPNPDRMIIMKQVRKNITSMKFEKVNKIQYSE